MVCQSCDKQRAELHARKSKLMPGMNLVLCNDCIDKKMEPRFLVILVGRSEGPARVADYIKNHRYVGREITAKELVK